MALIILVNDAELEQRLMRECIRRNNRTPCETAQTLLNEGLIRIEQTREELGDCAGEQWAGRPLGCMAALAET